MRTEIWAHLVNTTGRRKHGPSPRPSPHPMGRGGRPAGSRDARGLSPQPFLHPMERGRRGIAQRLVVLTRCTPEIYKDEGYRFMDAAFEVYNDRGYGLAEVIPQWG